MGQRQLLPRRPLLNLGTQGSGFYDVEKRETLPGPVQSRRLKTRHVQETGMYSLWGPFLIDGEQLKCASVLTSRVNYFPIAAERLQKYAETV